MSNVRFKLMAGLAGATMCLFAVGSYAQNTNAQTTPPAAATGSVDQQQPAPTTQGTEPTTTGTATTPTTTDGSITTTATDATTTTRTFPMWGIIAAVVLVLLVLVAVFRGRDRTVIRETYASSSTNSPGNRSTGTATAADDRARAASGTGTTSGGINDPNAKR
jgi:hypothetical protein